MERADDGYRATVAAAAGEYERVTRGRASVAEMFRVHRELHAALLARCPNERMLTTISGLAEHSQRFQALALGGPQGHHDVVGEHRTLCDHVLAGRVDDAVAFLADHLRTTLDAARGVAGS
jgi:DNA-binding GntR family transcriptional regulator